MNQHLIDKLLHKAGARFGAEGIDYSDFTSSKFAELIVQECIDELDGKIYRAIDHEGDEIWPDLILKEHFGVEE
jgi:hypothetical protein